METLKKGEHNEEGEERFGAMREGKTICRSNAT